MHFHSDCDGVVSAYFVTGELDRLGVKYSLHPSLGASVSLPGRFNISLDLSNVQASDRFNLSVDHHPTDRYGLFHANPFFSGFEWPVSFTTYALFGSVEESWIAAIGVVADWTAEKVPERFWEIVEREYPFLVNSRKQEKLVEGPIGEMALMIDSTIAVHRQEGAIYALDALKGLTPEQMLEGRGKAKRMLKLKEKVLAEVESVFGNELVTDRFVLLRFSSKNRIKSLVAAWAKKRYPDRLVVIAQDEGEKIRLSFRNGTGLNTLAAELTNGIGYGGGHDRASGGMVYREKWEEFKKRLFQKFDQ